MVTGTYRQEHHRGPWEGRYDPRHRAEHIHGGRVLDTCAINP
jgi:hypothetical protein